VNDHVNDYDTFLFAIIIITINYSLPFRPLMKKDSPVRVKLTVAKVFALSAQSALRQQSPLQSDSAVSYVLSFLLQIIIVI
jgi:hypothetical protein